MDGDVAQEMEDEDTGKHEVSSPRHYAISLKSAASVVAEDGEEMTPDHLSKTPKHKLSSSSGKTRKPVENNLTLQKVKKRLADWKTNHAVSGPGGKFMSFEQNKAANDDQCSPGEFKSSALMQALELRSNLKQDCPSFVKSLVRSHVASCFCMGLPGTFCKSHLPAKDSTMTLEDEAGRQFQVKYIAHKAGLSAGWRQFSAAQKLIEGDVLVFQLVGPTKFKVHVVRPNDLIEADGALNLLNLDSYTKCNIADTENIGDVTVGNSNNKSTKSLPSNMTEKSRKPSPLRPVPRQPEETSEYISEVVGLSLPAVPFQSIRSFEDFNIIVDGLSLDSELPKDMRKKYYKLCCSQAMFLHEHLICGMNRKLIVGSICETVGIADAIKSCSLSTTRNKFVSWEKTLKGLQLFGMNVEFLRARLCKLARLAYESDNAFLDTRNSADAGNEPSQVQDEIKNIEARLVELKEACDKFGVAIEGMNSKSEIYESKFQEEISAPW